MRAWLKIVAIGVTLLLSNKVTPIAAIFNHALIKTQNDYFLILYIN